MSRPPEIPKDLRHYFQVTVRVYVAISYGKTAQYIVSMMTSYFIEIN